MKKNLSSPPIPTNSATVSFKKPKSKPLNIVIDIRPLMGGKMSGVEVYLQNLLKHLFLIDKKNNYLLFANSSKKQTIISPDFKQKNVFYIKTNIPNKLLNFSLATIKRPKLDKLILGTLKKKLLLPQTFPAIDVFFMPDLRLSALSKSIKKVSVIHDLSFYHFPKFFSTTTRIWHKFLQPKAEIFSSHKIIAVSAFTKTDLEKTYHFPSEKIAVIHEGVDEHFNKHFSSQKSAFLKNKYQLPPKYFLFLSTLEPRKNLKRLIEAFKIYKEQNPKNDLKLVIAGRKNDKIFSSIEFSKHPDIIFTGFIEEEDKAFLIQEAVAFIYPSLFEGFGLPLLEAMKCQTPLICSNTSSIPEVAGEAALYIDPLNIKDFTNAFTLIQQPGIRKKLQNAMSQQVAKFTWEKCARQTLEVFNQVV